MGTTPTRREKKTTEEEGKREDRLGETAGPVKGLEKKIQRRKRRRNFLIFIKGANGKTRENPVIGRRR